MIDLLQIAVITLVALCGLQSLPKQWPDRLVLPAAAVLGIILGFGIYTASAGKAAGSPNDVRQIHRCMPLAVAAPAAPATPCC